MDHPVIRPIGDWWNTKPPEPIIWRDSKGDSVDAVLSVGEVALLSGAGGTGKSMLTRTVALAGACATGDYGCTCGLRVTAGAALLISYEDSPERIVDHVRRMVRVPPERLMIWPFPEPLWVHRYGAAANESSSWSRLWKNVRAQHVRLVVIDPANVAFTGASTNDGGPVRVFLHALAREAGKAQCGVLIVTHDTKAGRDATKAGEDPGAGAVAGAAAWHDGVRGVITLRTRKGNTFLKVLKSSYGASDWGAVLDERYRDGSFSGFKLKRPLLREAITRTSANDFEKVSGVF